MIASFWEEIFKYGDQVKREHGIDSPEYKTVRELDRRMQEVYDKHNKLTEEVLETKGENLHMKLLLGIKDLHVDRDDEGYRYRIGNNHFETPAEVLQFIIDDRNKKFDMMLTVFDDILLQSVECSAIALFNKACADFHEEMDARKPYAKKQFRYRLQKEESE